MQQKNYFKGIIDNNKLKCQIQKWLKEIKRYAAKQTSRGIHNSKTQVPNSKVIERSLSTDNMSDCNEEYFILLSLSTSCQQFLW